MLVLAHLLLAPLNDTSQTIHLLIEILDTQFTIYIKRFHRDKRAILSYRNKIH